LNGDDLNTNPAQTPSHWTINFFDWPLSRIDQQQWDELTKNEQDKIIKDKIFAPPYYKKPVANDYPDCLKILERDVKPERIKNADKGASVKWWQFLRMRGELYSTIAGLSRVLGTVRISKYLNIVLLSNDQVFNDKSIIIALNPNLFFTFLQSTLNIEWAWKNSTTLGASTIVYTPGKCLDTFPFPQNLTKETEEKIEKIGEKYHEFRRQLMLDMQLGLTKTYNLFHDPDCNSENIEKAKEIREFKSANLQIPIGEAIQRIEKLRALHTQMDESVLKAYGWTDIDLAHNYHEVDYLWEKGKGKKKTKTSTTDENQGGLFGE